MKRIQRKRKKGWKMPENTKYVGRPTKFGNPFKLDKDGFIMCYSTDKNISDPWIYWSMSGGFKTEDILELYERWIKNEFYYYGILPKPPDIKELKGYDLACFCPLDKPCHADILINLLTE